MHLPACISGNILLGLEMDLIAVCVWKPTVPNIDFSSSCVSRDIKSWPWLMYSEGKKVLVQYLKYPPIENTVSETYS